MLPDNAHPKIRAGPEGASTVEALDREETEMIQLVRHVAGQVGAILMVKDVLTFIFS